MAHKTLINGTAYDIKGGKTLIDGTAYSVNGGKTLVNGTAYEVGFIKEYTETLSSGTYTKYAQLKNHKTTGATSGWLLQVQSDAPKFTLSHTPTQIVRITYYGVVDGVAYPYYYDSLFGSLTHSVSGKVISLVPSSTWIAFLNNDNWNNTNVVSKTYYYRITVTYMSNA